MLTEQMTHNDTGASGTTTYVRDIDGNVVAMSYPSGAYPQYAYDLQERCTGMYSGSTTFSHYTFSGNWLMGRALANGLCTTYQYQPNGRVWEVWQRKGNLNSASTRNSSISRRHYGYEPDGQVSWFAREAVNTVSAPVDGNNPSLDNGFGDAFRYDPDGSLNLAYRDVHYANSWPVQGDAHGDSQMDIGNTDALGTSGDNYGNAYGYDAAGNRVNYTYRNTGQPGYSARGDNGYNGWGYDGNNNTTATANTLGAAAGWSYGYDAENHLTSAFGPNGRGSWASKRTCAWGIADSATPWSPVADQT